MVAKGLKKIELEECIEQITKPHSSTLGGHRTFEFCPSKQKHSVLDKWKIALLAEIIASFLMALVLALQKTGGDNQLFLTSSKH